MKRLTMLENMRADLEILDRHDLLDPRKSLAFWAHFCANNQQAIAELDRCVTKEQVDCCKLVLGLKGAV